MTRVLSIFVSLMLCGALTFAQGHMVKGRVNGPDGNAVQGITVQVKGTKVATATDADGQYQLNVSENSTLMFTGVGFEDQSVNVDGRSTIDVRLTSNSKRLNEVVVTALGISRDKKALG